MQYNTANQNTTTGTVTSTSGNPGFFHSYNNITSTAGVNYPSQLFIGSSICLLKTAVTQPVITYGTTQANSSVALTFDTAKAIVNTNPNATTANKGCIGMHTNVGG